MCDKCTKRVIGREIIELSSKIDRLFKKIDANPSEYDHDLDLISLMDKLAEKVEQYRKK